jgi:glycerol-3-phosphate O-acyltransferase
VLCEVPVDIGEKDLIRLALGLGRQYAAQNRLRSFESVSALLFSTARQVAADQGLLDSGAEIRQRRNDFLAEITSVVDDLDRIEDFAQNQFLAPEHERGKQSHPPSTVSRGRLP